MNSAFRDGRFSDDTVLLGSCYVFGGLNNVLPCFVLTGVVNY